MAEVFFESDHELDYSSDFSSDDEEEKLRIDIPMSADCKHMEAPSAEAASLEEVLPLSLEELHRRFLASDDFWRRLCTGVESSEFSASPWQERQCCQERVLKFTIPVKHFLGPKSTPVTQTHTVRLKDSQTLMLHTSSVSHNVPYADSFTVQTKWKACAETNQGNTRTWVKIHWELKWNRSVWVKSLIEKNAMEGARLFLEQWLAAVKETLKGESTVTEVRDSATPLLSDGEGKEKTEESAVKEEEEEGEEEEEEEEDEEEEEEEEDSERESKGAANGSGEVSHTPRKPQRKARRRSEMEAMRGNSSLIQQEQEISEDSTLPWIALILFLAVLSMAVLYPLLQIRSHASLQLRESEREFLAHESELMPRLSLTQETLGRLSHSITLLPGQGLREQWERHWKSLPVPCLENARHSAALPPSFLYSAVAQLWSYVLVVAKAFTAIAVGALLVFLPYSIGQTVL